MRIAFLLIGLGIFSAIYTYLGGLAAVVKTDIIQFLILVGGGIIITILIVRELGGWSELYQKTPQLMKLHLPADHPTLPWTHMLGLFFLNINYWCANQTIIQRSLAARSLAEAQKGLMVGGVLKYLMAVIIVVPGVALAGILGSENALADPDQVFPYVVSNYLSTGVKGLVLCALFASLMSTVDSTFNSIATLWSVDIYKGWIQPEASETDMVRQGRGAIIITLISGITMGLILLYLKFENPEAAFTHTLNELRYYINCGTVVLICSVLLFIIPKTQSVLVGFLMTVPLQFVVLAAFPEMNYFVRAFVVIVSGLLFVIVSNINRQFTPLGDMLKQQGRNTKIQGLVLLISLVLLHIALH
jgi:SSS family solute:Na+ symporter